jgi:hypothetical protein
MTAFFTSLPSDKSSYQHFLTYGVEILLINKPGQWIMFLEECISFVLYHEGEGDHSSEILLTTHKITQHHNPEGTFSLM